MLRPKIILFFLFFPFLLYAQTGAFSNKNLKILVLISSSDSDPLYPACETIWHSFIHLDPDHVDAYFIKSNPNLKVEAQVEGDVLWAKAEKSGVPGIMQKTLLAFEKNLPRIHEFDYIVRTTVTSFFYFPHLFNYLETLPKTNCCSAVIGYHEVPFPSGAGIILSPDLVRFMVSKKSELRTENCLDDVLFGRVLAAHHIPIHPATRHNLLSLEDRYVFPKTLDNHLFHFRIKNTKPALRFEHDIFILKELLKRFYNINLL